MVNRVTEFNVDKQGFEIATLHSKHHDFDNTDTTSDVYYKEVEQLIKETTGATHAIVFDHTVRKGIPGSNRRPAHHVHNDYTNETGSVLMCGFSELTFKKGNSIIQSPFRVAITQQNIEGWYRISVSPTKGETLFSAPFYLFTKKM